MTKETAALPTRVGHAEWGDNRFRGYSVARDLAGHETMAGLLALAVGGRRLDPGERALLEDLATVGIVGDPRVWPLKLVRVASSYGRYLPAVAALDLCFNGARVGQPLTGLAAEVLVQVHDRMAAIESQGDAVDDLAVEEECKRLFAGGKRPAGFGVPFRRRDERLDMLAERVTARGRSQLTYWRLFTQVVEGIRRIRKVEPNICLGAAAICLDMGFRPPQIGALVMALVSIDFWANAVEGAEQAPAVLQTLPEGSVRYIGPAPKWSPRAVAARSK